MAFLASTQTDVKKQNKEIILKVLLYEGPMTRADLAKKIQSSKPTVSKNVEALIIEDKVIEIGKDDNRVGKKGMLLSVNEGYGYVLALDLSKNQFRAVLADLKGYWVGNSFISLETYMEDNASSLSEVLDHLKGFVHEHEHYRKKIKHVIVSYSGVIGHNDELYLTNIKFKETLLNLLMPYIREELQLPLSIKNDVNLAVIAEKKYGASSAVENLCLLSGDIGVGVGIIINNKLYEGDRNAAGEVGFILPSWHKEGQYHTLEEKVSIHALTKRFANMKGVSVTFEDLRKAIKDNDSEALLIYEDVLMDVSMTITNIASILDIQRVVVVGRLFDLKTSMVTELNERIVKMTPFETHVIKTILDRMSLRGAVSIGVEKVVAAMV